jgi:two-component system, chemotaxis family, sensor kinase Cph1
MDERHKIRGHQQNLRPAARSDGGLPAQRVPGSPAVHVEHGNRRADGDSLIADGRLWGLLACHHKTARRVGPRVRSACAFPGQLLAQQIVARACRAGQPQHRAQAGRNRILVNLARAETFQAGEMTNQAAWLALTETTGVAVVVGGEALLGGRTASAEQVKDIAVWLHEGPNRPVFATDSLAVAWPPATDLA